MNARFTAAAQAVAEHFYRMVVRRGEPFEDTFIDPMHNDAVTPTRAGIPVALLKELVSAHVPAMFMADGVTSNPEWLAFEHNLLNPDAAGIVVAALPASQIVGDAERFVVLAEALLNPDSEARGLFERTANGKEPTSIDELREFIDGAIRLRQGSAA